MAGFVQQNRRATSAEVRTRLVAAAPESAEAEAPDVGMGADSHADPLIGPPFRTSFLSDSHADAAGVPAPVVPADHVVLRDDDGAIYFDQDGAPGPSRVMRLPPDVPVPSRDMVRRHKKAGHTPYMPWCATCVSGACNAPAHVSRAEAPEGGVPEVHCDYGFFKDKKGDVESKVTVLVTKDRPSGGVCADVVPKKGSGGGYAVKQLNRNLKKFGHHRKVLLRSDGEAAIKDLLQKVSELRSSQTVLEHTPAGDSRANGRAERAVQAVEKKTRVLKLATEENLGKFSCLHPCFPWLVMHAADCLTKYHIGVDGTTAYEKLKGWPYSGITHEFGACVLYQISAKVQGGDMSARWAKGIWLGKRFASEEHLIGISGGSVVRSGAVKPHPELEWDSGLFDTIAGSPWDPLGTRASEAEGREHQGDVPHFVVPRGSDDLPVPVRKMQITQAMCLKYGYTLGCGCQ